MGHRSLQGKCSITGRAINRSQVNVWVRACVLMRPPLKALYFENHEIKDLAANRSLLCLHEPDLIHCSSLVPQGIACQRRNMICSSVDSPFCYGKGVCHATVQTCCCSPIVFDVAPYAKIKDIGVLQRFQKRSQEL